MSEAFDRSFDFDPAHVSRIVVHENSPGNPCPDGVASALLLRAALPHAPVSFVDYVALDSIPVEPGVLFCDICPGPERARAWVDAGAYVLDHHASRKDVVALFGRRGVFGEEPGVSGAVLAYRHVYRPWNDARPVAAFRKTSSRNEAEDLALLAGIRDTWRKTDRRWKEACEQGEALRFWPWAEFPPDPFYADADEFGTMLEVGRVLYAKSIERSARTASEAKRWTSPRGTKVAVIPTTETSDVSDLVEGVDVLAGFRYRYEPKGDALRLALSFRSRSGYDVSELAGSIGGGGHRAAAGASLDVAADESPYAAISRVVAAYEGA